MNHTIKIFRREQQTRTSRLIRYIETGNGDPLKELKGGHF